MSLIITAPEGGSAWPLLEAGTYPAVCVGIYDLGEHDSPQFGKRARKVLIMWELPGETQEFDGKAESRTMSQTYTASLGEKANLRKMLDGWRGRPFTPEELKGFDLHNILGVPCLLGTVVKDKSQGGGQYASISTVSKLPKGFPPPEIRGQIISFDLDSPTALQDMEGLPRWIQERIKESVTYQAMTEAMEDVQDDKNPFAGLDADRISQETFGPLSF